MTSGEQTKARSKSTSENKKERDQAARDDQRDEENRPQEEIEAENNEKDLRRRLRHQQRQNAVLAGLLQEVIGELEEVQDRLAELDAETDAYGKQLEKVRASIKKDPCDVLDEYDRKNGWTDIEARVRELELEVSAESLSRFDRLSKMSLRQLRQNEEVSPREAWAVLLLRNFDGWSKERVVGDIWYTSDGMKKMFYRHLDMDVDEPSCVSTKKVHRACDKAMELTDQEVLWVKLDGGRALVRPKDKKRREKLRDRVKRTGN